MCVCVRVPACMPASVPVSVGKANSGQEDCEKNVQPYTAATQINSKAEPPDLFKTERNKYTEEEG